MTLINEAKKELSITFKFITNDEDKGYLVGSVIEAIRWNSLCDHDEKYIKDSLNVLSLTSFLKQILATVIKEGKPLTININTVDPAMEINSLQLAIIASFRWYSTCSFNESLNKKSSDTLALLAYYLEEMVLINPL